MCLVSAGLPLLSHYFIIIIIIIIQLSLSTNNNVPPNVPSLGGD